MNKEIIDVVAGIIRREDDYLVAKRPEDTHLGGYWEFPGGKPEPGESDRQALRRELQEELAIQSTVEDPFFETTHSYDERIVQLRFYHCSIPDTSSPEPVECERIRWVHVTDLPELRFPPADRELLSALQDLSDSEPCEINTSS